MKLTFRHFINPHKALTPFFIVFLMVTYGNWSTGAFVYLALHGTYCLNWFLKEITFPDRSFSEELDIASYVMATFAIYSYWLAPWLLISRYTEPYSLVIFAAIFLNISGTFLHYCSDAQKYFMLEEKKRLITNGLFARSRNVNYLGEIMIYFGFAILAQSVIPLVVLLLMITFIFFPKMRKKDKSISRYDEFKEYEKKSNLLVPKLF